MNTLSSTESELIGTWVEQNGSIVGDDNCKRIEWLTTSVLDKIGVGEWTIIYCDKTDGRFWQLYYPESHMHGGGPPSMKTVSKDEANEIIHRT
jgi:hypothetical protein